VEDAINASKLTLAKQEIEWIEMLAERTGINTRGSWEKPMM